MKWLLAAAALALACNPGKEESGTKPTGEKAKASDTGGQADTSWPQVGIWVATRTYGVGKVVAKTKTYAEVETKDGQRLKIPVAEVAKLLRPLSDRKTADDMLAAVRAEGIDADKREWKVRHPEYLNKIRSGSAIDLAKLLRIIYATEAPLPFAEAKMAMQLESLVLDEIARARGVTLESLQTEIYGRYPKAAPKSKRAPMAGDCWLRFCFQSIEVSGARSAKDTWLGFMQNGNRLGPCVPRDHRAEFILRASVDKTGVVTVADLKSKASDEVRRCAKEAIGKVVIRGPAAAITTITLGFSVEMDPRSGPKTPN